MKLRTGRRNPRNLYLQLGDEPADTDPCLGLIIHPPVARVLAGLVIEGIDETDLLAALAEEDSDA